MYRIILLFFLSSVLFTTNAQIDITGFVRDKEAGEYLAGATIMMDDGERSTITDELGRFVFKNVAKEKVSLQIRFLGYTTMEITIDVTSQKELIIELEPSYQLTGEVVIKATRVTENSATTFSNITKGAIQKQNFGQDLPFLLNWSPSLVTTSDAGTGIGYTGLRIRGSDATRINVTINGIPYNDSESQNVFWVDVPDIASSTQSIQVQRGVGTSTNGAGAFGGSINMQTLTQQSDAYTDLILSGGSFNSWRTTLGAGTGLIANRFMFDGRVSRIGSDGFIDRASSDLSSYYLSGGFYGKETIVKAIVFGGKEVTYQSWYGVPESRLNGDTTAMLVTAAAEGWNAEQINNLLNSGNRTFNVYTYDNQVDDYGQDHYQLHGSQQFGNSVIAQASLHYTRGKGFYEEYRYDDAFSNYGVSDPIIGTDTIQSSDLIRRRWLDNDFYGFTFSMNYEKENWQSVVGGAWNRYLGDHFGQIIWAEVSTSFPKDYRYYFNQSDKRDVNVFWKNQVQLSDKINGFIDLQYRSISYMAEGIENKQNIFAFDADYHFFNPKAGITYTLSRDQHAYASYSIANREPVRSDFVDAPVNTKPIHETMGNLEAGYRVRKSTFSFSANYFLMNYKNQLVLSGEVNDVGALLRTNVSSSYRTGLEVDGLFRLSSKLLWNLNFTVSENKIREFTEVLYDYGLNWDEYNEIKTEYKNTDISFSPRIISGSMFSYRPIETLEFSWLFKYVGKQFLDNTSSENRSIDPYLLNDLRLTYTWKPAFMRELSCSLLLNNIFDAEYSSNGYTWGYRGGGEEIRQNYFYPQAGFHIMGMLSIRL